MTLLALPSLSIFEVMQWKYISGQGIFLCVFEVAEEDEKGNSILEQPCFHKCQNLCSNECFFSCLHFLHRHETHAVYRCCQGREPFLRHARFRFQFFFQIPYGEKMLTETSEYLTGEELQLLFPQSFSFVLAFPVLL